jgi:hypothetical protein
MTASIRPIVSRVHIIAGRFSSLAGVISVALLGPSFATAAAAHTPSGLVVIPRSAAEPALSYLKLEARPGRHVRAGAIELLNPGARTLRVALAAVDGRTLDTLGSAYEPAGSATHGATRWLALERRRVVLAPHEHTTVGVSVRIPRHAAPEDRLSGVSIEQLGQNAHTRTTGKGAATVSAVRYAIGVETVLPGARRPLVRFTGASVTRKPAGLTFSLELSNKGNVILKGVHGSVRVVRHGHTVISRPIPAGTFLANTTIAYPVPAYGQRPPEGTRYRIRAALHYRGGVARLDKSVLFGHRAAVAQQRFGGPPAGHDGDAGWWETALIAAVALYCLLTTALLLRGRLRRDGASYGVGAARGGDGPRR